MPHQTRESYQFRQNIFCILISSDKNFLQPAENSQEGALEIKFCYSESAVVLVCQCQTKNPIFEKNKPGMDQVGAPLKVRKEQSV